MSPSTVSAVLNGSWKPRRISEKTTQIIRSLALDLDYSANRQAKGLRNAKSGVIGLCCRSMTTASSRTWRRSSRPRRGRTG
ncbi:LacI family DNA-binding transcriptional regulator [Paracoccus methylovorus]|uniref:LacI family DNA-binding transcriptional regulator n=1 Tax=Paracoccus methylovorus TaxID=2812658 RepID=A0ABX7JGP4_9RHOB|nr:LacI family DNA-binding transcriptional regulator [Paracoccus methylovorus]